MIRSLLILLVLAGNAAAQDSPPDRNFKIEFYCATWCPPCKQLKPEIQKLDKADYPVIEWDYDDEVSRCRHYAITKLPTILLTRSGEEVKRLEGYRTANEIAAWYNESWAVAKKERGTPYPEDVKPKPLAAAGAKEARGPPSANPKPWETVVRIRVIAKNSTGFGSGTVIASTDSEAIVLTCGHIFKLDGQRQPTPDKFPLKIAVDTFDGVLGGSQRQQVKFVETFAAKVIDYDLIRDVGLIRVATSKRLPASRVVPADWEAKTNMKVITAGCSEGRDATVWDTKVRNPRNRGMLAGRPDYEAIECDHDPKQGRSGGGLYSMDGYVIGVCNFAEPQGKHGLYATQHSIYRLLDRNSLTALYERGSASPELIAKADPPVETTASDPQSREIEARCLQIFKRLGNQGQAGKDGATGATGQRGPKGDKGDKGDPGQAGQNGTNGKDATGTAAAPVDLTAILNRLTLIEQRLDGHDALLKDIVDELKKPLTVGVILPGGAVKKHDFPLTPLKDGSTGIGAKFPNRRFGIDMSDFAVPAKTPSK